MIAFSEKADLSLHSEDGRAVSGVTDPQRQPQAPSALAANVGMTLANSRGGWGRELAAIVEPFAQRVRGPLHALPKTIVRSREPAVHHQRHTGDGHE